MAEQGGYRQPSEPAVVSGPGALSQRTDSGQPARYMSGGEYGEGQEMMDLQTSAPMAKSAPQPRMRRGGGQAGIGLEQAQVTPLFAPTERPDEPITAGAPFGPGPGPASMPSSPNGRSEMIIKYLPSLEEATRWPDTPETFKALVRYLQGMQ